MSEFQGCEHCKHSDKGGNEHPCKDCVHCITTVDHYTPKTNADRIRNMTVEELAEFLGQTVYYCRGRQDNTKCEDCPLINCRGCNNILIGEWLQAEVKEGNSNEST